MRTPVFVLLGVFALTPPVPAADLKATAPDAPTPEVTRLVEQLGDPDFKTREAAAKKLGDLGQPTLAPLEAAARSENPEVAERAGQILTSVRRRLDTEKALAPTPIQLPVNKLTVREFFDLIEGQTRYKLRIDGDQAILTQQVQFGPTMKPFWEVVQQACDAAGLEVAAVSSLLAPTPDPRAVTSGLRGTPSELNLADAVERLTLAKKALTHHQEQIARYTAQANGAKGDEKKRLDGLIADEKRLADRYEKQIAEIETRYGLKVETAPPLGTITLRAKTEKKPSCLAGAVRIEAEAASADALKRYTPDQLAVALRVTPEPKLRWNGVAEAAVVRAVAADDREVRMHYPLPEFNPFTERERLVALKVRQARLVDSRQISTAAPPGVPVSVIPLLAPPGEKVTKLKTVDGFLRGTVWTEPDELLAVRGLKPGEDGVAEGPDDLHLQVKVLDPNKDSPDNTFVEVTLTYGMRTAKPDISAAHRPVWIENRGGRAALPPADQRATARTTQPGEYGLQFLDPDGRPLVTAGSTTIRSWGESSGPRMRLSSQVRWCIPPVEAGKPATLAAVVFRGSRLAEVTVPFKLTDVPVAPGIGDGKSQAEDAILYKR